MIISKMDLPQNTASRHIDPNIEAVQSALTQKIYNIYKKRQGTWDGEKVDGGMNYAGSHGLDLYTLRKRSIKAFYDSMQGRAVIKRLNDTVINTGLALESTPVSSILGLDQEERKEISGKIEDRFKIWQNSKNCDVSRENTLGQIERIQFNNQLVKGDYFAALPFSTDTDLINPLQVKIIKPEQVSTPFDGKIKQDIENRGNYIVDGVEFNENDEEVAIYVKSKKPKTFVTTWKRIPKYGPVTGRQILIHGNTQEFGYEHRGVPALAHVAHELEKITDYSLLELMAAIANATVAAVVEPSENAPATNPLPGNSFIPPSLQKTSTGFEATEENLDSGYTNLGKNVLHNAGGLLISSLNKGEKYQSFDTKRPNVNFETFVDTIVKYLAASLGMPVEVLHMQFGNNFSASRASLKMYWQSVFVWRNEFVSDFMTPVYNSWLLGEVGTANLILRGFDNPQLRAAWQAAMWVGIPDPSIDPFKEARAHQIEVDNGFQSREAVAQSRYKSSFDSNVDRLASENAKLAEANKPLTEQKKAA